MIQTKEKIYFPKLLTFHEESNNVLISAVRTKLAADGLRVSPALLLLLGGGIDFFYRSHIDEGKNESYASAVNPHFLRDLCLPLGLYLEDFRTIDIRRLQQDIKRNLLLRVAPPMIEIPGCMLNSADLEIYPRILMLVAGLSEDESELIVVHPMKRDYLRIAYSSLASICEAEGGIRWLMINSPSFSKPVFPPLELGLKQSLQLSSFRKVNESNLLGMTLLRGEQAFKKCINDLYFIGTASNESVQEHYLQHLMSNTNVEFGVTWGRTLLADALQEVNSFFSIEHILQDVKTLADNWKIWTEIISSRKDDYSTISKQAIEKLNEIYITEKKIADFFINSTVVR
ncbi:hypothetical protein NXZ77_07290 [Lysinibacillus boronitolerans]|uniref:hypothetical protein n=1 Tax=Lysinibacillus boronitolerans TaxID=309788 RepID=UPI00216149F7|nr:hypothetical protein [Lysinibacillus boronitolerans]MCS1391371.1 hypothetical protein [Lysinibacillus boronitolerans]